MKYGLQLGQTFIGIQKGITVPPFTENVESGMPWRVVFTEAKDLGAILQGKYTDTSLIELFGCVSEIFAPIDAIASRVTSGKFQFVNIKTGKPIEDNELLNNFLESPNPFQNFKELLYEAVCYELVTGKEYMLFNTPDIFKRVSLDTLMNTYNLPADQITLKTPDRIKLFSAKKVSDVILGYTLAKGSNDEITFDTEKVLHRKAINLDWSDKKLNGRSPLLSAEKALKNLIAVYEARRVIYVKRGALGMWVSRKKDDSGVVSLTPSEKKEARKDMDEAYGLNIKKDTVGITGAPVDFIKTALSIADLQPFEETMADAAAIYAVYNVPQELMPQKDKGTTFENQRIASRNLYRGKAIPIAESYCRSIANQLKLRDVGIDFKVTFDHIEVLQENRKESADVLFTNSKSYQTMFLNGVITLNDWVLSSGNEKVNGNSLYDKRIYEMDETEIAQVERIMQLQSKAKPATTNEPNSNNTPQN